MYTQWTFACTKMNCNRMHVLPISFEERGIGWLQGRAQWDEGRPDDVPAASRPPKYGRFLPEAARLIQGVIHSTHGARLHPAAHLEHKTGQAPSGQARKKSAFACVKSTRSCRCHKNTHAHAQTHAHTLRLCCPCMAGCPSLGSRSLLPKHDPQ